MKKTNLIKTLKNFNNPIFLRNAFFNKLFSILYRINKGDFIFDEYWDNLIILDACRYDYFKDLIDKRQIKGNLKKKKSRGAHTKSFLIENFRKENYNDIIYVTANPYVDKFLKDKMFKIISPWKDQWDEVYHTVLPKTIYEIVFEVIQKYPEKRLIIHFMQPHYPYIGYKRIQGSPGESKKSTQVRNSKIEKKKLKTLFSMYSAKVYANMNIETQIEGYKRNLELVLDYVEKLIEILPGTTIVTSDHGEAFGEKLIPLLPFRFYGHHIRIKLPVLLKVPWLKVVSKNKEINKQKEISEKLKLKNSIEKFKNKGMI